MNLKNSKIRRFKRVLLASIISLSAMGMSGQAMAQEAAVTAPQVDERYVWDLTAFYPTKEAWEAELVRLRAEVDSLDDYKGRLGDDAATLLAALDASSRFSRDIARLWTYASNFQNANLANTEGQDMVGRLQSLWQAAGAESSFMSPEIVALGSERVARFIAEEPELEKHALSLRDTLRQGAHVLSPETEQVLTLVGSALSASESARSFLANTEIEWPTITLSDGKEIVVNQAGYVLNRQAPNRDDRIAVFDAFWGTWSNFESTFGATLNGEVQANVATAKARNYDNTLQYFLSGDNIPEDVYRTLVQVTNARMDVLHRYFRLRGRMLGIEDLGYHDIYPALVETDITFPIDETREHVLASMDILGPEFAQRFAEASQERWMHV